MKKILVMFIALFITTNVYALEPTNKFYVNDYADILSDETEEFIFEKSKALDDATTAQIVVITVKDLKGKSIEECATATFRQFGIGDKEKNNGLLLLLALEERQFRVEVGYGLEGDLPDGKTGRMQDEYIIPYLKENKWDEGITNGYKAFYEEVAKIYDFQTDVTPVKSAVVEKTEDSDELNFIATLLVAKVIYTIIIFLVNLDSKKKKITHFSILETLTIIIAIGSYIVNKQPASLWFFLVGTPINIWAVLQTFDYSNISTTGGYSSGGHSSGGWSSGGGGGFFGGGGSSGGGGSTRGF